MTALPASAQEGTAGASDDSGNLETVAEIVVTAQKRMERLLDVPMSVSAVTAETLAESNQTRLQDYFTRVPGLNLTPSVQGQQNLTIRGITTGFANPTVGVTVDDVPFGASGGLPSGLMVPDIDPGDLARVEVLRGPQGTLYGASSMGGLFKFVTADPSTDGFSGKVQAGLSGVENGDKTGYQVRGLVNVPLNEIAAFRLSGFARHDPGYIDNVQTGEQGINSADIHGGRFVFLVKPSDHFSAKLNAMYQKYEGDGQSEIDNLPGLNDLQQDRLIDSGVFERELQSYSLVLEGAAGPVDLVSVTGYNILDNSENFDFTSVYSPPLVPIYGPNGVPVITNSLVKRFTQELRATVPLGSNVDWLIGGFYSDESNNFDQFIPVVRPGTGAFLGNRTLLDNGALHIKEYAGFTDFTFRLSDRFDVQVGGRYGRIEYTQDAGTAQRFPPTGTGVLTITPGLVKDPDNVFTYLLSPRFKINPDFMTYARIASGYRIGGGGFRSVTENCVIFSFPCEYGPDKTLNYELGGKGTALAGALTYDVSVYYIDWKDIQIQGAFSNSTITTTFNTNGSRARSTGVEISLEARPVEGLNLSTWVVYNSAELTESLPVGPSLPVGSKGDRLPLSSEWSGNFRATKDFALMSTIDAQVGLSFTYIGSRPGLFAGPGQRVTYPDYTKLDLNTRFSYNDWSLDVYVNNATDSREQLSGGPGFFPATSAGVVVPRTIGMSITREF